MQLLMARAMLNHRSGPPLGTATLDTARKSALIGLSGGNLIATATASAYAGVFCTHGASSGKYYCEVTLKSPKTFQAFGLWLSTDNPTGNEPGNGSNSPATLAKGYGFEVRGYIFHSGGYTPTSTGYTQNDVIGIAADLTALKLWFSKNGAWISGDPATGSSPSATIIAGMYYPGLGLYNNGDQAVANFGGSLYAYTPPAGFGNW